MKLSFTGSVAVPVELGSVTVEELSAVEAAGLFVALPEQPDRTIDADIIIANAVVANLFN